jgi:hypothetical protein
MFLPVASKCVTMLLISTTTDSIDEESAFAEQPASKVSGRQFVVCIGYSRW